MGVSNLSEIPVNVIGIQANAIQRSFTREKRNNRTGNVTLYRLRSVCVATPLQRECERRRTDTALPRSS